MGPGPLGPHPKSGTELIMYTGERCSYLEQRAVAYALSGWSGRSY